MQRNAANVQGDDQGTQGERTGGKVVPFSMPGVAWGMWGEMGTDEREPFVAGPGLVRG